MSGMRVVREAEESQGRRADPRGDGGEMRGGIEGAISDRVEQNAPLKGPD